MSCRSISLLISMAHPVLHIFLYGILNAAVEVPSHDVLNLEHLLHIAMGIAGSHFLRSCLCHCLSITVHTMKSGAKLTKIILVVVIILSKSIIISYNNVH